MWLVWQSKHVNYFEPVEDPLFFANESDWDDDLKIRIYSPSQSFSLLACYDSFQICNPNNGQCTGNTGINDLRRFELRREFGLGLNPVQTATAIRFAQMSVPFADQSALGPFGESSKPHLVVDRFIRSSLVEGLICVS